MGWGGLVEQVRVGWRRGGGIGFSGGAGAYWWAGNDGVIRTTTRRTRWSASTCTPRVVEAIVALTFRCLGKNGQVGGGKHYAAFVDRAVGVLDGYLAIVLCQFQVLEYF